MGGSGVLGWVREVDVGMVLGRFIVRIIFFGDELIGWGLFF